MTKRLLSLVIGNVLTLGAIYIYASQSQVDIEIGTYAMVMMMFILLYSLCIYIWSVPEEAITNHYSK